MSSQNQARPLVVISGVNLVEAGPLSVIKDAVKIFHANFIKDYRLIILVYDKNLYEELSLDKAEILEFRYPKKLWLLRVWFEYVHSYFLSKKLKPYFWFAIHDMTPNVKCTYQAVYCHNPAAFYKLNFREIMFEKSLIFFQLFYKLFYKINIRHNRYVIVQQNWLRKVFKEKLKAKNVIVAYPNIAITNHTKNVSNGVCVPIFIFPSLARVFKNFEVLLQAGEILSKTNSNFEIIITISGTENKYAAYLKNKFHHVKQVKFIGVQSRTKVFELYAESSCLIFPSKLETWGLPVTEMKSFNKPIFIAKQPYAYETVGNYNKVCFFDSDNPNQLAQLMKALMEDTIIYDRTDFKEPEQPFITNWSDLFSLLLNKNKV